MTDRGLYAMAIAGLLAVLAQCWLEVWLQMPADEPAIQTCPDPSAHRSDRTEHL